MVGGQPPAETLRGRDRPAACDRAGAGRAARGAEPSGSRRDRAEPRSAPRRAVRRDRARRRRPSRRGRAAEDPFAAWPQAESAEVIEDVARGARASSTSPGEIDVPDGYTVLEGTPSGHRRSVAIVVSRFNGGLTNRMLAARDRGARGGRASPPTRSRSCRCPGAFELPLAAMALAKTRRYACVVALGAIVRGETPHFDYVASEAASGPAARGDRDRRAGRLRRAHGRDGRAGRGADRPCRRGGPDGARDGRRLRPAPGERPGLTRPSATLARPMSKVCSVCGKKPGFGNNRSHSMVATNRRFDPNLQRVRMLVNGVAAPRVRLHPLPQGRQGAEGRLGGAARAAGEPLRPARNRGPARRLTRRRVRPHRRLVPGLDHDLPRRRRRASSPRPPRAATASSG